MVNLWGAQGSLMTNPDKNPPNAKVSKPRLPIASSAAETVPHDATAVQRGGGAPVFGARCGSGRPSHP